MQYSCIRCASEAVPYSWSKKLHGEICISCFYAMIIEAELEISGSILPNRRIPIQVEHI